MQEKLDQFKDLEKELIIKSLNILRIIEGCSDNVFDVRNSSDEYYLESYDLRVLFSDDNSKVILSIRYAKCYNDDDWEEYKIPIKYFSMTDEEICKNEMKIIEEREAKFKQRRIEAANAEIEKLAKKAEELGYTLLKQD